MEADELVIVIGNPLDVTAIFCDVTPAPNGTLRTIGLGLAISPDEPPEPTVRLTWKVTCPCAVFTNTVPVSLPENRADGFTLTSTVPVMPEIEG